MFEKMFRRLLCSHSYKEVAKRRSFYCTDHITFADLGEYEEILYVCKKCGKKKIKTVNTFLNNEWKKI